MIGNKYAAEELARNFQERMLELRSLNRKASEQQEETPAACVSKLAEVKAEDFLIAPVEKVCLHSDKLDSKIKEISHYAEDKSDKTCSCESCGCESCSESHSSEDSHQKTSVDFSGFIDKKAEYVLYELGKIAGDLRGSGNGLAADMVSITASDIKNSVIKKAANKMRVISGLQKMASDFYGKGDNITGDVVSVTIRNIMKRA